jgi:diguanylate cyclase (GGDEF)-like protein
MSILDLKRVTRRSPHLLRLTRLAGADPVTDLEPYKADVDRALSGKFRSLYFSAPLERLFEHETQHARSGHLVAVGILWIVIGLAAAILFQRSATGPVPFGSSLVLRAGLVTPVLVAVVFAVWWGVRPFLREFLVMLASIIAPASMILGVMFSKAGSVGANRGALTIVLLFITVVVRLRFWFAVAACLSLVTLQAGVPLLLHVPLPGSVPLALVTIVITLAANYTLEREYRLHYLQRLLGRIQGAQLSEMVEQLHELSLRDPLTGLANRRALDELLNDLCARGERFSVILVDVDAFKAFNDTYGHQIGDDCLRRLSAMMRASLRFTTDRIARMGGEEFAVVLPGTAMEDAYTMAERMRRSVNNLQIPHAGSPTSDMVSISAGVSEYGGGTSPAQVIAEADKALYRAKVLGRNRVEMTGRTGTAHARLSVPA